MQLGRGDFSMSSQGDKDTIWAFFTKKFDAQKLDEIHIATVKKKLLGWLFESQSFVRENVDGLKLKTSAS